MGQIDLFADMLSALNDSEGITDNHVKLFLEAAEAFYMLQILHAPGYKNDTLNLISNVWDAYHSDALVN